MRRGRAVTAAACVLASTVLAGCSGSSPTPAATTAAPTPIARLDPARVRLARAPFCDRVPDSAVRQALGGKPEAHDSWGNGDPVPGANGSGDVGHEIGCAWTAPGGIAARAWVFARPVAADPAGTMVGQAGQQGCTSAAAPAFGRPALLQTCPQPGGVERVRRAGLFGDTWLTCEVAGGAASKPRARLDAWCAAVVSALDVG